MPPSKKKDLSLAVLVAVLVAGAGLLPLAYYYGQTHRPNQVATAPAPAPGTGADVEATVPAPPGAEVVPPEEAETDRGPASASPAGPTLSAARAAGLHLTPDPLRLNSSVALVVDQGTGQVLARKNDQAVLPIASLTKLMTALVVLEANQPMDEVLTITEEDVDTERHSRSRLRVGTSLTREEALHLALMSSENRAAHALGRAYPGGMPKMVERMNARARELGMRNTTYVDPTGLSNRNQSTAQDVAVLVDATSKHALIRDFSTTPAHLASLGGRTLQYRNSNRLVRSESGAWDVELQKTGYIVEAGRCLTMVTKVAGHNLIMVLLDADTNGARLADAERLRRWVVAQNGWEDNVAVAKAKAEPDSAKPRKVEVAEGKERTRKSKAEARKKKAEMKLAAAGKDRDAKAAKAKQQKSADKDGEKTAKKEDASSAKKGEKLAADKKTEKEKLAAAKKKKATKASEAEVARKEDSKQKRVKRSFAAGPEDSRS
jgi:D-alanyl-D-alanine endopeptidase (penicillin-binding protein 7)